VQKRGNPLRKSRVRWFSDKPKGKRKRRSPRQFATLRMRDLARIFRHRYGVHLPNDDAGRDDAIVAVNHLAHLPSPFPRIMLWLGLWTPWLTEGEQQHMAAQAIVDRLFWTADELAWRLGVTSQERRELGVTTIGAIDENRAQRLERRQTSARERMAEIRRAEGVKSRADYLRQFGTKKPWEAEGISRRTWFRRRNGTGSVHTIIEIAANEPSATD
jgi:hypothetical protein